MSLHFINHFILNVLSRISRMRDVQNQYIELSLLEMKLHSRKHLAKLLHWHQVERFRKLWKRYREEFRPLQREKGWIVFLVEVLLAAKPHSHSNLFSIFVHELKSRSVLETCGKLLNELDKRVWSGLPLQDFNCEVHYMLEY